MGEKFKVTIEIDADDLWSEVLGANPEIWGWWHRFSIIDGNDDKVGCLHYEIDDPDKDEGAGGIKGFLTVSDLVRGYQIVCDRYPHLSHLDEQDAISADAILQCTIFDDIIYG